ncbi:PREDICTED: uncharacterized protein LOC106117633 isoform X2 [Papilio xuthus]|uniref:Uncharacterized protein LOC106117633 isoform X2 n=1 Tax=Papilio xuthus TaxID=66420 RepID=A0AAJ6Z8V0_PAPXU|nr:PREDICTED: uncharacterized protein LOC106117633 isoform X2 [Papilio xuthus]
MSPRKQPNTLFKLCVKTCISLINSACYVIEKSYPENKFGDCEREAYALKCHLMSMLPARLFDVLCLERTCCQYRGDPRIQLHVLTHPKMTVFRKCDLDNDAGLYSIVNLKQLRILAMDPPRNERANRIGRCVSQAGIIMLISELPYLEELRIESCDIGATLITTVVDIGPLSLKKINCHFASGEGIKKLIKICPYLKELSVTHLSAHNKDAILEQLALSDLRLTRLDLSFFFYSDSMQRLLAVKGSYLTHFSLWEIEHSLTLEAIVSIGVHCPNLVTLCLMTQSKCLVTPRYFKKPDNIFRQLRNLTIGNDNYNIHSILTFFLDCTDNLQKLILKYQTKINIDDTLLQLIQKGKLKKLNCLWLDCTLEVSKEVVKQVIQHCEHLQMFTVDFTEDISDMQKYICENNLDIKLGGY